MCCINSITEQYKHEALTVLVLPFVHEENRKENKL